MAMKASKCEVWVADMMDEPGALAAKLAPLAEAGADLESVVARRTHENPGHGVVYVTPIKGSKQTRAAKSAGFAKAEHMACVRVEMPNKPGVGAKVTDALAEQGLNLHGLTASVIGNKAVAYVSLPDAKDVNKAIRVLNAVK
jgi:hypothetical protein